MNVDLILVSPISLDVLASALGRAAITLHLGRLGRRHHARFELSREPKDPADAIRGFAKLVDELPAPMRRIWSRSTRELDIGFESGFGKGPSEWLIREGVIQEAARLGVGVRITVYPIQGEPRGKRPARRPAG